MISDLINDKHKRVSKIIRDVENKIQKIIQKEFSEYQVKVNCGASVSELDSVEIIKDNKRIVFYMYRTEGSHIRRQNKKYNFLYDNFSNNEIKEIRERLEKLFI